MHQLPLAHSSEGGRLLRLLLLWIREVPAHPAGRQLLCGRNQTLQPLACGDVRL